MNILIVEPYYTGSHAAWAQGYRAHSRHSVDILKLAGAGRTEAEIAWRLRAEQPGDHVVAIHVGDEMVEKRIAVGGPPRKVPVLRTKSLEGLLYPGEPGLPGESRVYSARLRYPERDLGWLPGGEMGVLATFFGLSILSGFALKGLFGVTL